ncbi:MAG: class I SAM-dependent DNA methyltransferase [Treponema sp.]
MEFNYFDDKAAAWDDDKKYRRAKKIFVRINDFIKDKKFDSKNTNKRLLDFGCGTGLLGFNFVNDFQEIHFADISEGMLNKVKCKAESENILNYKAFKLSENFAGFNNFPFYNAIVTLLAFHHINDIEQILQLLASHIVQGGFLAVSDLDVEDGSFHAPMKVPHNGIDRNTIINFMKNAEFEILCNETVYVEEKNIGNNIKEYPIFLILGKKR